MLGRYLVCAAAALVSANLWAKTDLKIGDGVLVADRVGEIKDQPSPGQYLVSFRDKSGVSQVILPRERLRMEVAPPLGFFRDMFMLAGGYVGRARAFYEGGWVLFEYQSEFRNWLSETSRISVGPGSYARLIMNPVTPIGTILYAPEDTRLERVFENGWIQISYRSAYRNKDSDRERAIVPSAGFSKFDFSAQPQAPCGVDLSRREG